MGVSRERHFVAMKPIPVFFLVLLCTFGCTEGRKREKILNCHTVWNGTFYNEHNKEVDTKIIRKGDVQVEYYKNKGACKFNVEWLDSCSYRLTYVPGDKGCPLKGDLKPITVQILEVQESSYKIEGWVDGQEVFKYTSELHRGK